MLYNNVYWVNTFKVQSNVCDRLGTIGRHSKEHYSPSKFRLQYKCGVVNVSVGAVLLIQ